ncbi:MAG: hypothetical protein HUU18_07795 [Phycisphaerales bacterium]|nr:hypothetical protein [Phycisphaerales bacterium]
MKHRPWVIGLVALFTSVAVGDGPFDGHQVLRVETRTLQELAAVSALSETVWSCTPGVGAVDVQATPAQRAQIEAMGLPVCVLVDDVQALVDAEAAQIAMTRAQADAAWFATFRTFDEIHARLDHYAATYPAICEVFVAGQTLEGRPIKGIRLSAPDMPGNPRATRPQVLFNGTQHAREWVSPMTVMFLADSLAEGYGSVPAMTAALTDFEVILIPIVNADGYVYTWAASQNRMWRKNRRPNAGGSFGVDPNRNWGYEWGGAGASTTPSNDTYRGPSAFSEPETQVMRDFISAQPRLRAHIDFHSYSQLILSPWGYTPDVPADHDLFTLFNRRLETALAINGMTYLGGPSNTTIYPASGVMPDWVYGARGVKSWTIELRDTGQTGFILPADQILPTGIENLNGVLTLLDTLREPLYLTLDSSVPAAIASSQTWSMRVKARSNTAVLSGMPVAHVRNPGGEFAPIAASSLGQDTFSVEMPSLGCNTALEYYFEAQGAQGQIVRLPADAPASFFRTDAFDVYDLFVDDMETDRGWTVGSPQDNATAGFWERADPEPTPAQPGDDHTPAPGVLCWVTGAAAGGSVGANDVDGGQTTLTSPVFSALPPAGTVARRTSISFWYWYSNNQGSNPNQDTMPVELSTDGGATWQTMGIISGNLNRWEQQTYTLMSTLAPTGTMRMRFIARDLGGGSIVEAAIDDVRVYVEACPRSGDFNGSGGAPDDADVADFFAAWNAGDPSADFDGSGGTPDDADVALFFEAWNRG